MPCIPDKHRWVTPDQVCGLMALIPEYLEAQQKGQYDQFWPKFYHDWFLVYPPQEPTAADATDSESEPSESDVPPDSGEEDHNASSTLGKQKPKAAQAKAKKWVKKVH